MKKELTTIILIVIGVYIIVTLWKNMNKKKTEKDIMTDPTLNEKVVERAVNSGRTFGDVLHETAQNIEDLKG